MNKVWFEGKKTVALIFTEEDLDVLMRALNKLGAGSFAEDVNEFDKLKTRVYFQLSVSKK